MDNGNGIERTLGKILATQELILKQIESHTDKLENHIKEDKQLEKRIDKIDQRFHYLYGIGGSIIFLFTVSSDIILAKLGWK